MSRKKVSSTQQAFSRYCAECRLAGQELVVDWFDALDQSNELDTDHISMLECAAQLGPTICIAGTGYKDAFRQAEKFLAGPCWQMAFDELMEPTLWDLDSFILQFGISATSGEALRQWAIGIVEGLQVWRHVNSAHTKRVAQFQHPDSTPVTASDEQPLVFLREYMGDRTDEWILVMKDGKEIARHNVRYIASIKWAE